MRMVEVCNAAKRAAKPSTESGEDARENAETDQGDHFEWDEASDQGESDAPYGHR